MDFEIMLIKEDWEKVSQDLKKGLNEKWTKSGKYIFKIFFHISDEYTFKRD